MQAQVPRPMLLSTAFGREEIAVLRHLVLVLAADAGVGQARREQLGLAIHELTTNVVRHGGGTGRLDLWVADERMWFRVSDHGPGMDAVVPDHAPEPSDPGGRGLWIAGHVLDQLDITSGQDGTTIVGSVATAGLARPGTDSW
jgi:serine/threonine-protein kinase RsbW